MLAVLTDMFFTVIYYLRTQWLLLSLGITLAVVLGVYMDLEAMKNLVRKHHRIAIPTAIGIAALTPLCACGTMGVILALFVSGMPWGPVMAFLVTSPIASPSGFLFSVSFLGLPFASALFGFAIFLGLVAGFGATWLEGHTSFFDNQFRETTRKDCSCASMVEDKTREELPLHERLRLRELAASLYRHGLRGILLYLVLFIAIGRLVEPMHTLLALFGSDSPFSIPMATALGMPLYLSGPASLPLLRSFVDQGTDLRAILSFVLAGKATGLPVLLGMRAMLTSKVLTLYTVFLFLGALMAGYAFRALQFLTG